MIVICHTRGGSYIVAEMDGMVLKGKVGAFRVIPHVDRYEPIELPENIHDLIDLNAEELRELADWEEKEEDWYLGEDFIFNAIPNLQLAAEDDPLVYEPNDELDNEDVELTGFDDHTELENNQEPEAEGRVRTRAMHKVNG